LQVHRVKKLTSQSINFKAEDRLYVYICVCVSDVHFVPHKGLNPA